MYMYDGGMTEQPLKRQPRRPNGAAAAQVKMLWPSDLKAAAEARAKSEGYGLSAWVVKLVRDALAK